MSRDTSGGPREPSFHCIQVHVIYRTGKQRKKRFARVNRWMQKGKFPTDLPWWCVIIDNHGGGGGP